MQGWVYLTGAILLEVAGTASMKLSEGFTKIVPSILLFIFCAASFVVLTFAIRNIDVSMAYAIWAGIGTALITVIGVLYFREPASLFKFLCVGLIILGVAGLNLTGVKQ